MTTPKERYLSEVNSVSQTSETFVDNTRQPSHYKAERERTFHAQVLHDMFAGKIDRSVSQWADYLDHVAADPSHNYTIPGHTISADCKDNQYMLALLAGQASGKSALKTVLERNGTIDANNSITVSTSFFLDRFPELKNLDNTDARENVLASVRNEILHLQRLVTNVALANGVSTVLDIHIIEEQQAKALIDIAHKNQVPSILVSPHVSLETYGRRVAERSKREKRAAFKPEHILFHQIFADNFEAHFKHMFDLSILLDNNRDVTAENAASSQALTPIYIAHRRDGVIHEEIKDPTIYAEFKDKVHIDTQAVQSRVESILSSPEGTYEQKIGNAQAYIAEISRSLSNQRSGAIPSASAEPGTGTAEASTGNNAFQRFLKLRNPEGWARGG